MREIEAFLALAEELHFGRAAARLHRTVSSLSQTIKVLERRVGAPLFERTSRRVLLTPLGNKFHGDLAPAYVVAQAALRAAQHAARQTTNQQRLRVAATPTVPPDVLDQVTEPFRRAWPAVDVVWSTMSFEQCYAWFGNFEPPDGVDVAFCWVPSVSAEVLPRDRVFVGPVIARSARVLLMTEDHPLAGRATVDVEELADHAVVYPAAPNAAFMDAWYPPATPSGRQVRRRAVRPIVPEQFRAILADGLLHITAADIFWRSIRFAGLVSVPLTGLSPLLLVTTWPVTADSDLIQSFTASTARRPG